MIYDILTEIKKRGGNVARGKKLIDGQFTFEFCLDTNNYVVQSNTLICGKQALKLNSAKLIRSAIMQVVKEDEELNPYIISIQKLSDLLHIPPSNIYRDIDEITNDIINNPVFIKVDSGKRSAWIKIPWVSRCEYHSDIGVLIKLNDELKPYLINLKEHYTQYALENVLAMKSIYGIRIFELIQEKCMLKVLPRQGTNILLSIQEIRECCDCMDKYKKWSHLKSRVIDAAVKEIQRTTLYSVEYDCLKSGRKIESIQFHINMKYH